MHMWKLIAAALYSASSVRTRRAQYSGGVTTKFIGHVPVLNYNLAYQRTSASSLAEDGSPKGDWIVVLKKGVKDDFVQKLCITSKCMRTGHPSKGGVPFFEIHGSEEQLESIVKAAGNSVKFIEPDSEVQMIPEMKGASAASWGLDRIAAAERPSQGEGVNIYVLDTGVRASHTDFGGRVIPTLDLTTGSLVECNGDLGCAADAQGHGTHCAGTAAGTNFGVAPKATVLSVKVLGDSGSGSWSWSYDALDWLATKGSRPAVASMSLGGSGTHLAMQEAVDTAVDSGVVVVVAGGNDNSNACHFSPAFVPSAITVGSTNSNDERSWFSNYGSCTDLWAPGTDIVSASAFSDTGSETLSGTSMACPHVSGASALLLEATPAMSARDVLTGLWQNAVANAITGLRTGDTNKLLYVGAGGPPPTPAPTPPPPTPAPAPTPPPPSCPADTSIGPDSDGDCKCNPGLLCFQNNKPTCTFSATALVGEDYRSDRWFLVGCTDCECRVG